MYISAISIVTQLIFEYLSAGLGSSLSSGVVSKVIKIPSAQHSQLPSTSETDNMDMPVMLQTTAAVHPGASGGVLVNSHGQMVGLITRYKQAFLYNRMDTTVKLHTSCTSYQFLC
jgi:hypothetical protein